MTTAIIAPPTKLRYWDSSGTAPLSGGKVYFYEADGSYTTPKDTYSDYAASTPNTNPVILDANGEASIRLYGLYDVKVFDSTDVLQHSILNYSGSFNADDIIYTPPDTNAENSTLGNRADEKVSALDYLTPTQRTKVLLRTLDEDLSTPIQNAINYVSTNQLGELEFSEGLWKFNVILKSHCSITGKNRVVTEFVPWSDAPTLDTDATVSTTAIALRRFKITGDTTKTSQDGIRLKASHTSQRWVDQVSMREVDVRNCGRYGVQLYGDNSNSFVQSFMMDNCLIDGCENEGLRMDGWVLETSIRHSMITDNGDAAGAIANVSANVGSVDASTVQRLTFSRVGFSSAGVGGDSQDGTGVDLNNAKYVTFDEGCQFELCNPAINATGAGTIELSIKDSNFEAVYAIGNFINIDDCQGLIIEGNHFTVASGKTCNYCIYASGYPGINDTAAFRIGPNTYPTAARISNQAAYYETHTNVDETNHVLHVSHPLHTVQTVADTNADINSLLDRQGALSSNEFDPDQLLVLRGNTDTSRSTLKHGTGNIQMAGGLDFMMADKDDVIALMWDHKEKVWRELSRSYAFVSATTTDLEDQTAAVNTDNKFAGRQIWNSTTARPVWAAGSSTTDVWASAVGVTQHTPV